jgi:hypothetical protein
VTAFWTPTLNKTPGTPIIYIHLDLSREKNRISGRKLFQSAHPSGFLCHGHSPKVTVQAGLPISWFPISDTLLNGVNTSL